MKRLSRKCPNNQDHTMHRAFILQVQGKKRKWSATGWQYCPECRVMLPDLSPAEEAEAARMAGAPSSALTKTRELFRLH